ncbi:ATP-binding cassette domain-containing protein [Microbacterium keratanolyticum]
MPAGSQQQRNFCGTPFQACALLPNFRVIRQISSDAFEAQVPEMSSAEVRTLLAKFGLEADHLLRPAGELSPGERTRARLALLQARGVNLLVLDEPTNHLDLAAIEQLEQALESYEGALLLVTHDRRMLNTVNLDRRWYVESGQVTELL